jgi:hypothetical protein
MCCKNGIESVLPYFSMNEFFSPTAWFYGIFGLWFYNTVENLQLLGTNFVESVKTTL